ncbi:MAG TPA: hypothetical protein VIM39_11860, partial [Candidatus Limnocylindrales bacterium]
VARLAAWCAERGASLVDLRTGGGSLEERYLDLIGALGADEDPDDETVPRDGAARPRRRR